MPVKQLTITLNASLTLSGRQGSDGSAALE